MEVEIISKECIKPSSPTPNHLKTHKLSLLDQFIPNIYVPMVLFYTMNQDKNLSYTDIVTKRSQLLKQSLSETLTRFYPLAGQIKDNISIDCNDEGAYYIVAQVNSPLSEYLNQPDLSSMHKFLPEQASWNEATPGSHIAMLQETTFACGGLVIGAFVSHMIVDGTAMSTFLKSWAAAARESRNEAVCVCPNFDAPSIFLQNDAYPENGTLIALHSPFLKTGRCATRRFVFDASAIATLQAKATSSSVPNPTRIEAVSALICKCTMAALKAKSGVQKPTLITHAVNMRRRAVPPFPESSMGNFLWMAAALCPGEETELHGLVCRLREAIRKINGEFVNNLQGDGGLFKLCDVVKEMGEMFSGGVYQVGFSSWCSFGLYDVDFGWGKPMWATCVGSVKSETVFMNMVALTETRSGDGIEAWIYLDEEEMAVLEHDKELLAWASLEPSPLKLGNSVSEP